MELGIATRQQLVDDGQSERFIDAQIAAKRWRRLNDHVVALHNGPLTAEQARLAVFLSAQAPAALCGLTAAELWGLRGYEAHEVHIVVRRGARVLPVPGVTVVVHESRRFGSSDVFTAYEPARVSPARAVIDSAVWTPSPRKACRIVAAAVQQRRVDTTALRNALTAAGRVRHSRILRLLLNDLDGGAQALSEVEFLRFCRRHGLPTPRMNVRNDATGRRRYLDVEFDLPDGRILRLEIDGGIHLTLSARWSDTRRDNALWLKGVHPMRFPSVAIYTDDPEALAQIRAALGLVSV